MTDTFASFTRHIAHFCHAYSFHSGAYRFVYSPHPMYYDCCIGAEI